MNFTRVFAVAALAACLPSIEAQTPCYSILRLDAFYEQRNCAMRVDITRWGKTLEGLK